MTAISVTSVNVLDNPSKVTNPLQFEIQYECMFDLADGERRRAGVGRASLGAGGGARRCVGAGPLLLPALQPPRPCLQATACWLSDLLALSAGICSCPALHLSCCRSARAPQAAAWPACPPS